MLPVANAFRSDAPCSLRSRSWCVAWLTAVLLTGFGLSDDETDERTSLGSTELRLALHLSAF
jgi:hypothetical protein